METINSLYYTYIKSPIGKLFIAGTEKGVCRLDFSVKNEGAFLETLIEKYNAPIKKSSQPFSKIIIQLKNYFAGKQKSFNCKLDLSSGTGFQQKVWKTLMTISYGKTESYQWVATQIGNPKGSRAVGQANGNNPIPIIIPCHRVVSADGGLGGYSGGIGYKKKLLRLEGVNF